MKPENTITWRSVLVGLFFSALFAVITVYCNHANGLVLSATQIPVLPFALLIIMVTLTNPLCRLVKFLRPFSPTELMIVFMMGFVSGGISTFGLSAQVVPLMGDLFNSRWNTDQTEWSRYVEPYVSEQFFVAEPGIQKSAKIYAAALTELDQAREVYDKALTFSRSRERLTQAEAESSAAQTAATSGAESARLKGVLDAARLTAEQAEREWHAVIALNPSLAQKQPDSIMDDYSARIKDLDRASRERRAELTVLENKAFAIIDEFRRGLPPDKRAVPGFFPMVGDTFLTYGSRFHRMQDGHRALKELQAAVSKPDIAGDHVKNAIATLKPLAQTNDVQAVIVRLEAELEAVRVENAAVQGQIKTMSEQSRFAEKDLKLKLDEDLKELRDVKSVKLEEKRKTLSGKLDVAKREMKIRLLVEGSVGKLESTLAATTGITTASLYDAMRDFASFDASLRRYFLSDIPWHAWVPPMLRWFVLIGLTYAVLMAFNVLIFRQWAYNEKLIYPLVQIPEELAGVRDTKTGTFPEIFRSGLFWIGFMIAFSVMGWNLLCKSQWIPGLTEIDLKGLWDDYIKTGPLRGLIYASSSHIFFTMIGLAFLIPQKISFSLWFFTILYLVELLIIVGMGYGENVTSFPANYGFVTNFRYAEGGGALVVFSLVVLFKCRKYILCFFTPKSISMLELDEQKELRLASAFFLLGSLALILVLSCWMGANIWYTIFFYIIVLLVTIGLIRAVTEGGILGFQAWSSPFHFIRTFVGMDHAWTAGSLFAPLYVYFMVFFFDLKTFIAPAMANSIKIRDDLRIRRLGFHAVLGLGIGVAVVAAVLTEIMMSYYRGADAMNGWFYGNFPKSVFNDITSMAKTPPEAWPTGQAWMLAGAVVMTLLLFFRQKWFWLPHPLGLIMLVNPIMVTYWFSIMLGWLFKSLVTKYGNRHTYARARELFIGLILGELVVVALAVVVSLMTGRQIDIHLNRNGI